MGLLMIPVVSYGVPWIVPSHAKSLIHCSICSVHSFCGGKVGKRVSLKVYTWQPSLFPVAKLFPRLYVLWNARILAPFQWRSKSWTRAMDPRNPANSSSQTDILRFLLFSKAKKRNIHIPFQLLLTFSSRSDWDDLIPLVKLLLLEKVSSETKLN